jgi:16S rRNA (cytosine967-C5)-methyltransferase
MIKKSIIFRQYHFFEILNHFDLGKGPIDLFISLYLRHNPQLGSKDRAYIVERIYTYLRWKLLIEAMLDLQKVSGEQRKEALFSLLENDFTSLPQGACFEPNVRVSFPKELYASLQRTYGEKADLICRACNEPAPIVLRVNDLKISRKELLKMLLARNIEVEEEPSAPLALRLLRRSNLCSLPEFKAGYFEVQDAGSQQIANLVQAQPQDAVLDFCAGAGGKTLAFASRLQNRGQIFLHDIREEALFEAKKRLKRAGIQNAQIVSHKETARLNSLKKRMDWVLVDAPCSGTGTLRRNPDMKWKFSEEMLSRICHDQRQIFAEAFTYVKPGGTIVYATCSLLKEENDDQCEYFLRSYPLVMAGTPFRSCPVDQGMDGFYGVCLQRKTL